MTDSRSPSSSGSFDAVLIVSFGGPQGLEDVRPFLANVLRGRRVAPERVEQVAAQYARFNGVSPLTELTFRQARGLQERLAREAIALPVYVGMRNWHPFLADTLAEMSRAGVRRAIGFITSPHHCYSSCGQYKENVNDARRVLRERGRPDVDVAYVDDWYDHPGFTGTLARHVEAALGRLEAPLREGARLIFTAHSIPIAMARASRYAEQLATTARLVAGQLGRRDYALVYQSRSGRPQDPWLEPDIRDYLRQAHAQGLRAVVISPIGFVCDHTEVLYDLDVQAAEVADELALPMVRAETVNDDPMFIDMMTDVVRQTYDRYRTYPPLPIVGGAPQD